ncbi:hypothetical protein RI543_003801 [Arxiozyma heterogenica]|uniref:DAGKc domain-containing protein n=1 Tax=Arxiozyma heterogenica TaxID=278026 RepID=A0AAN7ZRZ8_9SACH|nr:hypothetical protein RI543_003801 [Kazachstania heterogenica]
MPFSYSNSTHIRGCLTSDGIRIKSQFTYNNDDDSYYDEDIADHSNNGSSTLICISPCVTLSNTLKQKQNYINTISSTTATNTNNISNNSNSGNSSDSCSNNNSKKILIPNETIIPFSRIIYAKYIDVYDTNISGLNIKNKNKNKNSPKTKKNYKQTNKSTNVEEQTSLLNHYHPISNTTTITTTTTPTTKNNDNNSNSINKDNVNIQNQSFDSDINLSSTYESLNSNNNNKNNKNNTTATITTNNNNINQIFIELTFVYPKGKDVIPTKLKLLMDPLPNNNNNNNNNKNDITTSNFDIVSHIIEKSYQNVRKEKSILIIINPYGGSGKALQRFNKKIKPILDASPFIKYEIAFTKYYQHAIDIAREIDVDSFDTIACCSGDGIPNEVINGLYQRPDRARAFNKICVTQLPCGSGNAMSISCHWTMNPSYSTLCLLKSIESRIDVMCCQQPSYVDKYPRLSFLSQTLGVIAESDINTEFIRWMGPVRFDIGVAFNILKYKKYPCDLYVKYATKTKKQLNIHYLHNKSKRQVLMFTPNTSQVSITDNLPTSQSDNIHQGDQTESPFEEKDFHLKYSIKDQIPDDWEKIDSNITDNLSIFYTGKMPYMAKDVKFFPAALPADGTIDMILTDTRTPIHKITPILLSLDKGTHVHEPEVIHWKVLAYRLVPKIDNTVISVDGENFPLEPLQVEVIPGLLKTLLRNGSYVDTEFDSQIK